MQAASIKVKINNLIYIYICMYNIPLYIPGVGHHLNTYILYSDVHTLVSQLYFDITHSHTHTHLELRPQLIV